jgi:peptidoglycan hydrolase CwlO-like protein
MHPKAPVEKLTSWIGSVSSLILHTIVFASAFVLASLHVVDWSFMLLVLTTMVSLEAIYLAIFIQMTVNRHSESLAEVTEDVEDIQEDIEEISEDVEDIQEDIEDITDENSTSVTTNPDALEQLAKDMRGILANLERLKEK